MLPLLLDIEEIHHRLRLIFPDGTPLRGYVTREMAARTVFVMLYIGAIEGSAVWMAPKHVYRMGDEQAVRQTDDDRRSYIAAVKQRGAKAPVDRWFHDNTREPIRDETLRDGLVRIGAVVTCPGIPTTSSKGRYALQGGFASLLDPGLRDEPLRAAIHAWQDRYLSAGGLARVRLQQRSATAAQSKVIGVPPGALASFAAGCVYAYAIWDPPSNDRGNEKTIDSFLLAPGLLVGLVIGLFARKFLRRSCRWLGRSAFYPRMPCSQPYDFESEPRQVWRNCCFARDRGGFPFARGVHWIQYAGRLSLADIIRQMFGPDPVAR
jgi:hypothetical protein